MRKNVYDTNMAVKHDVREVLEQLLHDGWDEMEPCVSEGTGKHISIILKDRTYEMQRFFFQRLQNQLLQSKIKGSQLLQASAVAEILYQDCRGRLIIELKQWKIMRERTTAATLGRLQCGLFVQSRIFQAIHFHRHLASYVTTGKLAAKGFRPTLSGPPTQLLFLLKFIEFCAQYWHRTTLDQDVSWSFTLEWSPETSWTFSPFT